MRNHSYENKYDLDENEHGNKTHFHMNGFARRLILKKRGLRQLGKRPIGPVAILDNKEYLGLS